MTADPVSWVDFVVAVTVVAMVVVILAVWTRFPEPPPVNRVSQRSMRNLLQRYDAERADDPDRQSA